MRGRASGSWLALRLSLLTLAWTCFAGACATTDLRADYAPGFLRSARIAALAVVRDGIPSTNGWAALGPHVPPPRILANCDLALGGGLASAQPQLHEALLRALQTEALSPGLIAQLAPFTRGDTMLLYVISGRPRFDDGALGRAPVKPNPGAGWHGRFGVGPMVPTGTAFQALEGELKISAHLIANDTGELLASLALQDDQLRVAEAIVRFNAYLDAELSTTTCVPWTWSEAHQARSSSNSSVSSSDGESRKGNRRN